MITVRLTRDTVAGGRPASRGEILELSEADARTLMSLRKAEAVNKEDKPQPGPLTTDDLKPKRDKSGK